MKRKIILAGLLIMLILFGVSIAILNLSDNSLSNDYIAVFHGGTGELLYETYIYKEENGHDNYGFKYVNVTKSIKPRGESYESKITKTGSVQWTDDVFIAAKKNNAYDYVMFPNDDKTYTIDEFAGMFLLN